MYTYVCPFSSPRGSELLTYDRTAVVHCLKMMAHCYLKIVLRPEYGFWLFLHVPPTYFCVPYVPVDTLGHAGRHRSFLSQLIRTSSSPFSTHASVSHVTSLQTFMSVQSQLTLAELRIEHRSQWESKMLSNLSQDLASFIFCV